MREKVIAVLLTVCIVVFLLPITALAASTWYDSYNDFIINRGYLSFSGPTTAKCEDGSKYYPEFLFPEDSTHYLFDLDKDCIPELFITNGGVSSSSVMVNIFQYSPKGIVFIGEKGGWCLGSSKNSKYPGLFFDWGHPGTEIWSYITLQNGKLNVERVAESNGDWDNPTMIRKTSNKELYSYYSIPDAITYINDFTLGEIKSMGWDAFAAEYGYSRPVAGFNDVMEKDWFANDIKYVSDKKLMTGTGNDLFSPNGKTTRGQAVTILYRLAGSPSVSGDGFSDVKSSDWFYKAVQWASKNGIASGYGDGRFGPNDTLNREQLATMLYRYAQFKKMNTTTAGGLSKFSDSSSVSGYALDAMSWAVSKGLISGTSDGKLTPGSTATRAQLAAILHRFCENFSK